MKLLRLAFVFCSLLTSPVSFADQESKREAEKFLSHIGMEGAVVNSMSEMVEIQLRQNPALAPYKNVMNEFFAKHMSWESLKPELVKIYSQAFTAEEMSEINRFYSTETGRKTIKLMPTLMAQGAQLGASRVQKNIGELRAMIKAESERLEGLKEQQDQPVN